MKNGKSYSEIVKEAGSAYYATADGWMPALSREDAWVKYIEYLKETGVWISWPVGYYANVGQVIRDGSTSLSEYIQQKLGGPTNNSDYRPWQLYAEDVIRWLGGRAKNLVIPGVPDDEWRRNLAKWGYKTKAEK